jgi:hypothetical protein
MPIQGIHIQGASGSKSLTAHPIPFSTGVLITSPMPVSSPYALFRAVDLGWPPSPRPLPASCPAKATPRLSGPSVTTRYDVRNDSSTP